MDTKICSTCKKSFNRGKWDVPSRWEARTICSASCRKAWNKGLDKTDPRVLANVSGNSVKTQFSTKNTTGAKNTKWKGKDASYAAKHMWAKYHFGSPQECEHCGTTEKRMYHWANISKEYIREREDWLRLCEPCHKKFDLNRLI